MKTAQLLVDVQQSVMHRPYCVARDVPAPWLHEQGIERLMVAFTRRGVQDPQQSPLRAHRDHLHAAVHRVQEAVIAAPRLSV